ncbi:MAG: SDR family NAD(P)-dependent oxidoreductase [Desulfobacteraceae bacterium]|nr:MAG: SDR family NAD(P)-dependent oxidoreductase [Desulfobacteraceae bacterium]
MEGKRVIVTGGSGFIGASLAKRLVDLGYRVRVLDNYFRGNLRRLKGYLDRIEFIEGDIRNEDQVLKAVEGMEILYHLAFINGTRYFYEIPEQVLDVGVRGALNTLKAARQHCIRRYILASSSEVYQSPSKVPTDEKERILLEDITNPRYSYAGGKIISELLTLNFLRQTDTETVIFRPHNVYGPDMGYEHVIPELMRKIYEASGAFARKEIAIEIQGHGEETRAFCFIDNAVEEIMLCATKGYNGEIYHIGEMQEIRILDLIQMMGSILNIRIKTIPGALRAGGTPRRCPDIGKIKALGYREEIPLEEGLRRTVAWYSRELMNSKPV